MSPYRVIVETASGRKVLSAMLSSSPGINKVIYVVDKSVSDASDSDKEAENVMKYEAHKQTYVKRSRILGTYTVDKVLTWNKGKYKLQKMYYQSANGSAITLNTGITEFTLSDCLRSAMKHLCTNLGYKIVKDL